VLIFACQKRQELAPNSQTAIEGKHVHDSILANVREQFYWDKADEFRREMGAKIKSELHNETMLEVEEDLGLESRKPRKKLMRTKRRYAR
jgi:hypothetical protein